MSLLSSLTGGVKSALGNLPGNIISGATQGVGSAIGSSLGTRVSNAINPPPRPLSAYELGLRQRQFMDAAYPNLNPWEQAGAGTSAGNSQQQAQLAREQMRSQEKIAGIQSSAQVKSSQQQADAGVQSAQIAADASKYGTDKTTDVGNRQVDVLAQRLQADIPHIQAQTAQAVAQTSLMHVQRMQAMNEEQLSRAMVPFAQDLARANLTAQQTRSLINALANVFTGDVDRNDDRSFADEASKAVRTGVAAAGAGMGLFLTSRTRLFKALASRVPSLVRFIRDRTKSGWFSKSTFRPQWRDYKGQGRQA